MTKSCPAEGAPSDVLVCDRGMHPLFYVSCGDVLHKDRLWDRVLFHQPLPPMKRLLLFAALFLTVGLSSCQCADKPDVGPIEDEEEDQQARVEPRPTGENVRWG